jgi:hypothetical protein
MKTHIERIASAENADVLAAIERWKALRAQGWELTVLHSYAERSVIAFGYLRDASRAPASESGASSRDVVAARLSLFDSPDE